MLGVVCISILAAWNSPSSPLYGRQGLVLAHSCSVAALCQDLGYLSLHAAVNLVKDSGTPPELLPVLLSLPCAPAAPCSPSRPPRFTRPGSLWLHPPTPTPPTRQKAGERGAPWCGPVPGSLTCFLPPSSFTAARGRRASAGLTDSLWLEAESTCALQGACLPWGLAGGLLPSSFPASPGAVCLLVLLGTVLAVPWLCLLLPLICFTESPTVTSHPLPHHRLHLMCTVSLACVFHPLLFHVPPGC